MIDIDKYEGHLASEGQTWAWSKWMLKNAETIEQHEATSALLNDAPLLFEEVKRLREVEDEYHALDAAMDVRTDERDKAWNEIKDLEEEVKRLRETIKVAITDLEQTNLHEETREDLLDLLKEMIK